MDEHKISLSRSEAFRSMPIRHKMGALDDKLMSSMREDGMLEDEKETEARDRLLESQYGAEELRHVMNPRYLRGSEGRHFRLIQKLDGQHIDRMSTGYALYPMDPDSWEKESDMVGMLQSAVANSEGERNKYLGGERKSKTRRYNLNQFPPVPEAATTAGQAP
jgi:hypothetical protein